MIQNILQTIETYQMLSLGDRIVVGFSGGADSVALLHILKDIQERYSIQLYAAHLNHRLRGNAASEDALFSQALCKEWGIPFFLEEVNVSQLALSLSQSEEETGRQARYRFFHQVMEKVKGNKIATAHHKNDQGETILHNIIRGTGMQGLTGIQPISNDVLIRPLLEVTKKEILEYLGKHGLAYREDATNVDSSYTRNRIRNQLIPTLEKDYNPDIVDSLARMSKILREEEIFLSYYSQTLYQKVSKSSLDMIVFDLRPFLSNHIAIQKRLIRIALKDLRGDLNDVSLAHIDAVIKLAVNGRTGSRTTIPGSRQGAPEVQVKVSYGDLQFQKVKTNIPSVIVEKCLPLPGQVTLENIGLTVIAEKWDKNKGFAPSSQCIYIDEDKIVGDLMLRSRKEGDRFQPLGMKGRKKLKNFFIDLKIPAEQRGLIPLLVDEDNIIWVIGFQMNHNYKLTESTNNIVKFSIIK